MESKPNTNNTMQAFWVMAGSLSSFGFAIASSALLSRYFDKNDYGTYKQVMYVFGTLLTVFMVGLPRAFSFFLPRVQNNQAKDLISKLNKVLFILGGLFSILLFFGAGIIADILKNDAITLPLRYFSLVPFFMLPTMGLDGILATYKQTFFLAVYKVLSEIFKLLCVVLPVILFAGNVNSAILGFTVSSFLCFLVALYLKYRPIRNYPKEKCPVSYSEVFKYILPIFGATFWSVLIGASDQFFISRYFGTEVFAEFANGATRLPFVGMIVSSTTIVLFPIFSKHIHQRGVHGKDEIIKLWNSVLEKTVKLIYPLVIFCFCFAGPIMIILFGERYANSGIYFQIKLAVNFFTVIACGPLLLSIGGERFYYKVYTYGALLLIMLEWITIIAFKSPYLVTVVSVVCEIGRTIVMLKFIANFFKIGFLKLFPVKLTLNIVLPSIVILSLSRFVFINILRVPNIAAITASGIVFIILFGFWVYARKIDYLGMLKPILDKVRR